jgi:hypothetical protein
MSNQKGGPDESRRGAIDKARQSVSPAIRRILAGISAATAAMRSRASSSPLASWMQTHVPLAWRGSSSSVASWVEAHVPPAWRRPRRLIVVGAVMAVIVLIIVTRPTTSSRPPPPGTKVFQIGNQVALRFLHSTGSVHLSPGPAGQVSITEHRNGLTDAINTGYRQDGNVITVNVSVQNGLPYATWVDFDVAVPQDTTANVAAGAGTLSAAGLTGNFALHDTNGSIWANNVSGAIALQTTSGSINTSHVSGQVSAKTDNGTITTSSTRLGGHSLVQAQSGTINFHGSLDPGSHAAFRNTNGAIGITLPRDSSVLVYARTPLGSINSEFPSLRVVANSDGRVADGRVGRGAAAHLSIDSAGGSIDLNRGR